MWGAPCGEQRNYGSAYEQRNNRRLRKNKDGQEGQEGEQEGPRDVQGSVHYHKEGFCAATNYTAYAVMVVLYDTHCRLSTCVNCTRSISSHCLVLWPCEVHSVRYILQYEFAV